MRRAFLDLASVLQDDDAIGDFGDHAEIVGDEHDRHAVPPLQVADQLQYLRLGGDVECRGRFVGDQHRRP